MATSTTVNVAGVFANGAEVGAYPVSNWVNSIPNQSAAPVGSATATGVVAAGSVTINGLTTATQYVLAVDGGTRYLSVNTSDFTPGQQQTADDIGEGAVGTSEVADGSVALADMANIATDRLIGRDTAGTGVPEALSVGGGVEFSGSGGIQRSALTGDVTASAASGSTTIAPGAVTAAKVAADVATQAELDAHDADTTNVHGIADTAVLATDAELAAHEADTTSVHGISDTEAIPLANIVDSATDRLLGRDTAGTGNLEAISLSTGLEFSGSGSIRVKDGEVTDAKLASPNNAAYKVVRAMSGAVGDATGGAGTYPFIPGFYQPANINIAAASVFYLDPADFAVAGRTTKYLVRATCLVNTVAPSANFTVGLYPVTASAGGADVSTVTLGTVIAGSTPATFTAPGAQSMAQGNSGDFTAPAADYYALAVATSAAITANSYVTLSVALQVRNV